MSELDAVVSARDVPEHGLAKGDVATIVHAYADHDAYEVEFIRGAEAVDRLPL